jgi:hypothetical protein
MKIHKPGSGKICRNKMTNDSRSNSYNIAMACLAGRIPDRIVNDISVAVMRSMMAFQILFYSLK